MVIKASDSNLNLDERFRLTKRGKKAADRQRTLEIESCLTLSADGVVQIKKGLFSPKTGSNNLLWSPVTP